MRWQTLAAGGLGTALLIVAVTGWSSYRNVSVLTQTAHGVAHTHQTLTELGTLLSNITEAESARRGYAITGQARDLAPFHAAAEEIDHILERLRQLIAGNPNQQQRIGLLKSMLDEKMVQLRHSIELQNIEEVPPELEVALTERGQELLEQIRWVIETMKAEEHGLLLHRTEAAESRAHYTYMTITVGTGLSLSILTLLLYFLTRKSAGHSHVKSGWHEAVDTEGLGTRPTSAVPVEDIPTQSSPLHSTMVAGATPLRPDDEFAALAQLRTLQQGEQADIVTELIDLFLEDTDTQLDTLRHALRRSDHQALQQAGHSLGGSCAMIGAQHMAHLCRELERVVYADDFKSADVVMSDLDAEFARIRRVLEAKRQGSSS